MSAVAGRSSSSRAAGPARPGLGRRPAQPGVSCRPARPDGDSELCRPISESCCFAGSAGRPGPAVRSGTRYDSIRVPDRGGKRGRRVLRRGRGRGGEGRGGEGGKLHTPARAQSHARTHAEPTSRLHTQRATTARAQTCSCTSNRAVHQHTIIRQQIEEKSELAEG